jgi:hypothetical protein
MTSIGASIKTIPNDARFFVPVSSLLYVGGINAKNATTGALTQATWMINGGTSPAAGGIVVQGTSIGNSFTSSLNGPGAGRLRDLGKTYISAGRDFRKVQLVWYGSATGATFGVNGASATSPDQDYLTGYIELGWEGQGIPAPVARMGP